MGLIHSTATYPTATHPAAAVGTLTTEYYWVKAKSEEHPVVLFSKTACGYCRMAKKILEGNQIDYLVHELNYMDNCREIQDALKNITGASTVCIRLQLI